LHLSRAREAWAAEDTTLNQFLSLRWKALAFPEALRDLEAKGRVQLEGTEAFFGLRWEAVCTQVSLREILQGMAALAGAVWIRQGPGHYRLERPQTLAEALVSALPLVCRGYLEQTILEREYLRFQWLEAWNRTLTPVQRKRLQESFLKKKDLPPELSLIGEQVLAITLAGEVALLRSALPARDKAPQFHVHIEHRFPQGDRVQIIGPTGSLVYGLDKGQILSSLWREANEP
jgi:hypothetical protein